MSALTFVNLRGDPVCIPSSPPKAKKPKADPSREKKHLGWRVTGFRPGVVEAAREAHKDGDGPFDADAWMSRHKPVNVRTKPYSLPCAASECARLAAAAGWTGVQVIEIIR